MAKHMVFSTWVDHLPFAYDLVGALRPDVIVELGTQAGLSYFCFCQAAREHGLSTRTFAVDTWRGDAHTDAYDEKIYEQVASHNAAHYADTSTLLRMLFEEALGRFENESIDLLHIDGYHTYEAVRGDFEAWYPKVRPGASCLSRRCRAAHGFRRLALLGGNDGKYETSRFGGFGLGVLRKPGPRADPLFDLLFSKDEQTADRLRALYVHLAEHQELERKNERLEAMKEAIRAQRAAQAAKEPT
jgi:hypothetical protein